MPSRSNMIVAVVIVVALGGFAAAYVNAIVDDEPNTTAFADPDDAVMVARGQTNYNKNCADCHGKNLEGQSNWRAKTPEGVLPAPPHDVTGHTWHHADQVLFDITKRGGQANAPAGFISGMPSFGETMSDDDIVATLAYIKSRWPEEVRNRQARMNR